MFQINNQFIQNLLSFNKVFLIVFINLGDEDMAERHVFYQLVHSTHACNSQDWDRPKLAVKNSSQSPPRIAGARGVFCAVYQQGTGLEAVLRIKPEHSDMQCGTTSFISTIHQPPNRVSCSSYIVLPSLSLTVKQWKAPRHFRKFSDSMRVVMRSLCCPHTMTAWRVIHSHRSNVSQYSIIVSSTMSKSLSSIPFSVHGELDPPAITRSGILQKTTQAVPGISSHQICPAMDSVLVKKSVLAPI